MAKASPADTATRTSGRAITPRPRWQAAAAGAGVVEPLDVARGGAHEGGAPARPVDRHDAHDVAERAAALVVVGELDLALAVVCYGLDDRLPRARARRRALNARQGAADHLWS